MSNFTMPTEDQIHALASRIKVMKPASPKKDDIKHEAKLHEILGSHDYVAEEKIDGCHYMMLGYRFISKDHHDKSENFPHLMKGFFDLGMANLILDGEIYYPGKTSQYAVRVTGAGNSTAVDFQEKNGYIKFKVFDVLRLPNGQWVTNEPYHKRRKYLEYLFTTYINKQEELSKHVELVTMVADNKLEFKESILASGGEGIVLKKVDSIYMFGKKPAWQWVKVKQSDETDLFIIGYQDPTVAYSGADYENWKFWKTIDGVHRPVSKPYYYGWIGSLVMGAYVDGEITKICTISGLSESLMKEITENKDAYMNRVVKVRFMEKTEAGYPRHPSFYEFHADKTAEECTYEF